MERLTSVAKEEILQIIENFQQEFYKRLEKLENKEKIEKLKKPSMQFCIHKTIMETAGTEDEEVREELLDLLMDRLNADEESTERVVIEDAIIKAAKLSKPLKALMVALLQRSVINPGLFIMDHIFENYGKIFKELDNLTGLDLAFGRQLQCIYPMSGLMSGYSYEDILLKNYDLVFRHRGTFADLQKFAVQHPCINHGVNLVGFNNMRIFSFDGRMDHDITDDKEYIYIFPSSEVLKRKLLEKGRSDMAHAVDELMATEQPFTHEEVRQYLHRMNEGWDSLFRVFQRKDVVSLLLSPVGNYIAMAYTRKIAQQPDNFLMELYQHNQGW